jgi:hypothetical protein
MSVSFHIQPEIVNGEPLNIGHNKDKTGSFKAHLSLPVPAHKCACPQTH